MIFFGVLFHLNQKISYYYAQNLPFPHTITITRKTRGIQWEGIKSLGGEKNPPKLYSPIVPGFGDLIMEEKFS